MKEQLLAQLEEIVGERTLKERNELLSLNEMEIERLIKYAKLAAFRTTKVTKDKETPTIKTPKKRN